ncbi:hypothetical protein I5907_19395 [Panacibacter sp. DH6]|uniref:Uncharacterized protein n=1 Tax=Panacibacter microcysteis TaxID=2793269 RepID=A0A931MD59_9BACT|nr:hypothetical protein [Panacibacter microcysteis]
MTDKHWHLVKDAHQTFLRATITFCSTSQVKSKYPKVTKELIDNSYTFLNILDSTQTIDSSIAIKIDSLNYNLLKSLVTFFDKLQMDKALFNQSKIRTQGKKVEYEIGNIGRQIHEFNYWIYEQNHINIKFKDISL